jgi:two-component system chemotaxis response regulator CheY
MSKTFLVVDDSQAMRDALKKILETLGHTVVGEAENGLQAIAKFRDLKPDVVTLDIIMPQMGGLESLRLIKALDKAAKVLMVSARSDKASVMDCAKAGATHYLLKPFESDKVAAVLKQVFESA